MKEDLFEDDCEDDLQITSMSVLFFLYLQTSNLDINGHRSAASGLTLESHSK